MRVHNNNATYINCSGCQIPLKFETDSKILTAVYQNDHRKLSFDKLFGIVFYKAMEFAIEDN